MADVFHPVTNGRIYRAMVRGTSYRNANLLLDRVRDGRGANVKQNLIDIALEITGDLDPEAQQKEAPWHD